MIIDDASIWGMVGMVVGLLIGLYFKEIFTSPSLINQKSEVKDE